MSIVCNFGRGYSNLRMVCIFWFRDLEVLLVLLLDMPCWVIVDSTLRKLCIRVTDSFGVTLVPTCFVFYLFVCLGCGVVLIKPGEGSGI